MPRPPRIFVPCGYYHVVLRGNHQEPLFGAPDDRDVLDSIVAGAIQQHAAKVHGYCWMTNHLHAIVQISNRPLGELMQNIAMRYSRYRHKTLRTTGHLFERRYRAKVIDADAYFLTALRYVHMNPVVARMVDHPADYPWSSHRAFLGMRAIPWLTVDFGLSMFGADIAKARKAYADFIGAYVASDSEDPEQEFANESEKPSSRKEPAANIPRSPDRRVSALTLEQFVRVFCSEYGVSIELLSSRAKSHRVTAIRAAFATQAIDLHGASLAEIARLLQRDAGSLSGLISRHQQLGRR
jgi:putative transposase